MKKINFLIIPILIVSSSLFAQSIVIGTGASIYVPLNADICAESHGNITGNIYGEGTQCGQLPLPVELISFTANVREHKVILEWRTETEVDNYGFDVQRWVIGIPNSEWTKIAFVEGYGNSNAPKQYSFTDNHPLGGSKFKYRLKQIDTDGKFEYSNEIEVEVTPREFAVYQNYPNPFNPSTVIRYSLPHSSNVEIFIFNTIGELIKKELLVNQEAGNYEWRFSGNELSSGAYFYRLQAGDFVQTKKMVLLR